MKRLPLASCRATWLGGLILFSSVGLRAQDVTLAGPVWKDTFDPPQELPALQGTAGVAVPEELKASPEIGYAIVAAVVDARGRALATTRLATHPALAGALKVDDKAWKFSPAQRAGQPVPAEIEYIVLFNPASAPASGPTATPRVLAADVVRLPASAAATAPRLARADVSLDAVGRIVEVKNAPPEIADRVAIALKNWKFAPARRDGQPVPAQVSVPLVLAPGWDEPVVDNAKLKATQEVPPRYPYALRGSGVGGDVLLSFLVDLEGRVRQPVVVRSASPALEDAALDAIRQWRFAPATKDRRPVLARMQMPLAFPADAPPRDTAKKEKQPDEKSSQSALPEELRFDTPPRLAGMVRPVFPYAALQAGGSGRAAVRVVVDENGQVFHTMVVQATSPEYGQALLAAAEHFTYRPALKAGKPTKALFAVAQEFRADETLDLIFPAELAMLERERSRPQSIVGPGELDARLKPVAQRAPLFPLALVGKADRGEAMVEFIVDEEGYARLPRVVSATEESLGYAALQGVAGWRFEPPTKGGHPAAVRVKAPIRFSQPVPGTK